MEMKFTGIKSTDVKKLISDILDILAELELPVSDLTNRRLERMAMACLAVGDIKKDFSESKSYEDNVFLTTRQIIAFENKYFGENISSGSYDDIRRHDLIYLLQSGIVVNSASLNSKATNNPTRGYALNPAFADLLKAYGSQQWHERLVDYKTTTRQIVDSINHKMAIDRIPVRLPSGQGVSLSFGNHNVLQKAIIEEFLPRFGMGADVLYLGDTSDKFLYIDTPGLKKIGFFEIAHEELPDVVAYSKSKNILFLIEAVHSSGPMNEIRVQKLSAKLEGCSAKTAFITAFLTKRDFKKWVTEIAWETEVWISESPDHMIHFNGYKFLEIHKQD